jgi:hypothetical protein
LKTKENEDYRKNEKDFEGKLTIFYKKIIEKN